MVSRRRVSASVARPRTASARDLMPKLSDMSLIVSGFKWFIVFMTPLSLCKGKMMR